MKDPEETWSTIFKKYKTKFKEEHGNQKSQIKSKAHQTRNKPHPYDILFKYKDYKNYQKFQQNIQIVLD